MKDNVKGFGKRFLMGILYIFVLPVVAVSAAGFAVIGLFGFFFMGIKSAVLYFKGKSFDNELEEDRKADMLLNPEKYRSNPDISNMPSKEVLDAPRQTTIIEERHIEQQPQIFIINAGQGGKPIPVDTQQLIANQQQQIGMNQQSSIEDYDVVESSVEEVSSDTRRVNPYEEEVPLMHEIESPKFEEPSQPFENPQVKEEEVQRYTPRRGEYKGK